MSGLTSGRRVSYTTLDIARDGSSRESQVYRLSAAPASGQPLKILLTSDHQSMPMTAANIEKAGALAPDLDAVFLTGDLVNIPGRASEWFDDGRGAAFFPVLQGRAAYRLQREGTPTRIYRGAPVLQNAPLFPAIGNHEVMGVADRALSLNAQFARPTPRAVAAARYRAMTDLLDPLSDADRRRWIEDASFNTRAYRDIFSLPDESPGGERYYVARLGDVAVVSLFVTRIWRSPFGGPETRGRYQERFDDLAAPERWGHGSFIFEPIKAGSAQYRWLVKTLRSNAFQSAPIKIAMLHHPPRGLGDNVGTPFADPAREVLRAGDGDVTAVRYRYAKDADPLIADLEPLFIEAGVDLVLFGHSHLWQRFRHPSGLHYLESSNVGNTYGCAWSGRKRLPPVYDQENYTYTGDPYGLAPVAPSRFAPQLGAGGAEQPCVASNTLTVFSILDSATRTVDSYVFDTTKPETRARLFDRFSLD